MSWSRCISESRRGLAPEASDTAARWLSRAGRRSCVSLLIACAVALGGSSVAGAQTLGYTSSLFGSHATYPADSGRAASVYWFNTVDIATGRLRASVGVPFVWRRSTFPDLATDPALPAERTETATGLGDPLIRADFTVVNDYARGVQLTLAGSVKLPVASIEDGLGTGETDVGFGGSLFTARGKTSVFADLMFWTYGDPAGVTFEDSLSYSVGLGRILGTGRWSAMTTLGGFSRGLDGGAGPLQLYVTMLALAGRGQSVALTAGIGLNDASSGFTLGTSWRIAR